MATIDTYLSGNYAPISEEITATALPVTGTIPAELDGRLIRNGPNPVDGGQPQALVHRAPGWCMVCDFETARPTGTETALSYRTG